MSKDHKKFKLGTADTLLLTVGTLAVDYICSSKTEIVEIMPGGKKLFSTLEELEEKIKRYGIKKGPHYPGSSIGNFMNQAQLLSFLDPSYGSVYFYTTLAPHDPSSKILLNSLDEKHIPYQITDFTEENAKNPIALLVETKGYTKILSFKDKRIPAIKVDDPKEGEPGVMIIGAAGGHTITTKTNALNYAKKHNIPVGLITTEGEINLLPKNANFKKIFDEILKNAAFFSCNEDEVKKILYAEDPKIIPSKDRVKLVQQLREVFQNPTLDILLSFGSEGSMVLVDNTVVMQKIPYTDRDQIISTAGAGDTLAGAFVQGVRMKGMDVEGVLWTLPRANRAAQNVLKYADTRSGQLTGEQFLEEPPAEFETQVINL